MEGVKLSAVGDVGVKKGGRGTEVGIGGLGKVVRIPSAIFDVRLVLFDITRTRQRCVRIFVVNVPDMRLTGFFFLWPPCVYSSFVCLLWHQPLVLFFSCTCVPARFCERVERSLAARAGGSLVVRVPVVAACGGCIFFV